MKALSPIFWISIVIVLAVQLEAPPEVKPVSYTGFSADNTRIHMQTMASESHFMGTEANRKVRDYLLEQFRALNIPAKLISDYSEASYGKSYTRVARTENIVAKIEGTNPGNAIVLAGHYDSVLSSPGAADDIHAVACMLETARLLKMQEYKNDIIFLITDGEEMGLLGAKAYVDNQELSHIKMLLNFEARGNSGAGFFFEWSEGNAWLVRQLKKAARRPVTNSLAYEVYKRLPNGSDFTHFKNAGIRGINHAFIDGFSYYHNPDDRPEHINMRSVQHTGENMYRMTQHFANIDLDQGFDSEDASFFNFMGTLIIYPANFDLLLLLLFSVAVILIIIKGNKSKISYRSLLFAFGAILLVLTGTIAINTALSWLLFKVYPQYDFFYVGQFYNHKWYIISAVAITLLLFWLPANYLQKKQNLISIQLAGLSFLVILGLIVFYFIPTATYLIVIPGMAMTVFFAMSQRTTSAGFERPMIFKYILSIIPLAIWGPVVITLYLAFSIKLLFVPAIIALLICMSTAIFFPLLWHGKIIPTISIAAFLISLVVAQLNSFPTEDKPLPANIFFHENKSTGQSYWLSSDKQKHKAHGKFFDNAEKRKAYMAAPVMALGTASGLESDFEVQYSEIKDSTASRLLFRFNKECIRSSIFFEDTDNIGAFKLNGYDCSASLNSKKLVLEFYGMTQDSMLLEITKKDSLTSLVLHLENRAYGLPANPEIPNSAILSGNYTSIYNKIEI